jgi:hypothetical protein
MLGEVLETLSRINCWIKGSKKHYIHTWQVLEILGKWMKCKNKRHYFQGQLQSKLTVLLLTSLSALTAAKQYLGDPIHCIFDTR